MVINMSELTQAQLERLGNLMEAFYKRGDDSAANEIFSLLDRNGNGRIDATELKTVMSQIAGETVPDDEVAEMLNEADTNKDGVIQLSEFIEVMKKNRD